MLGQKPERRYQPEAQKYYANQQQRNKAKPYSRGPRGSFCVDESKRESASKSEP